MNLPRNHKLFLTTILIFGMHGWMTPGKANPPRFDSTWTHFDDERSPLQKGLLDARDKKWRKNIKLGSDPRCGRVVREYVRKKDRLRPGENPMPKLCTELGLNDPEQQIDMCVRAYCCENPSDDLATCMTSPAVGPPETECNGEDDDDDRAIDDGACIDSDDEAIVSCASALIDGVLTTIKQECTNAKQVRTTRVDAPDDEPATCAEVIFSLDLRGQQGQRYLDCLENPFCPPNQPNCTVPDDPDIHGSCKHIFKELEEGGGRAVH